MNELKLRIMAEEDIPVCLDLCHSNHWNQIGEDWKLLLEMSGKDSRVATLDDKIVGSFTTINYGGLFSWIGMVLVDPAYQRRGIGKELMHEAIKIQAGRGTVKLDATPAGRSLYVQLGFKDEYELTRLFADKIKRNGLDGKTTKIDSSILDLIMEYDHPIFGWNRKKLFDSFLSRVPLTAFYLKENGRVRSYCLTRNGFNFNQIGPVVAEKFEDAVIVTSAAILNLSDKPVIMDITLHDARWRKWLKELGFEKQRGFTRMYLGDNKNPGIPEKQFAIAGPEFG